MTLLEIPIFKKTYDFYKNLNEQRKIIPKQDRFTVYQKTEQTTLEILELLFKTASLEKNEKIKILQKVSSKLNLLRIFIRVLKDTKTLDFKKYIKFEQQIDEIGRMLGGWIKANKN